MTPEQERDLRSDHVHVPYPTSLFPEGHCNDCWQGWPCDCAQVFAALDAERVKTTRLEESMQLQRKSAEWEVQALWREIDRLNAEVARLRELSGEAVPLTISEE